MARTTGAGQKSATWIAACVCAAALVVCLTPVGACALEPDPPGSLAATAGSLEPQIAVLTWDASPELTVVEYNVYTALEQGGPYRFLAATQQTTFAFADGVPGIPYYFRVTAVDMLGAESGYSSVGPVTATWPSSPHVSATSSTRTCSKCHAVHDADTAELFRWEAAASGSTSMCLTCHSGRNEDAANVASGTRDSFSLDSGHSFEPTSSARPAAVHGCESCHELHGSAQTRPMIPAKKVNGKAVASTGAELCLACHTDNSDWYGSGYPSTSAPSRDDTGYPVAGTWPGPDTYTSSTNAHRLIPETTQSPSPYQVIGRSEGDCLYCHAAHRGSSAYDSLLTTFSPSTASTLASDQATGSYAALCLTCHGGAVPAGFATAPANIRQFVTTSTVTAGHRIVTSGGVLPVGAPLPCYECHNAHGSKRGNASMLSDALGKGLETSSSLQAVRSFCFSCHTTSDAVPRGWDSTASAYADVLPTVKVVGLSRTGGLLRLPQIDGHAENDALSCYDCHGDDYTAGGSNVHNPGVGEIPDHTSPTSATCFGAGCHDASKSLPAVHALYVGSGSEYPAYTTSCQLCHDNQNPDRIDWATASMSCTPSCHSGATHSRYSVSHAVTSVSDECVECHGSDIATVHGATADFAKCATCHANTWNWSKTGDCTTCHNGVDVGTHAYTPPASMHYSETTHTASPFTIVQQGVGADGPVNAGGQECSTCHSADLKAAHGTTSASGGSVVCAECHNDTTLGSSATISAGWPSRKCVDCHDTGAATTHDAYTTIHFVPAGTCAGTGSSCHDFTDLAALHAVSQSGGAAKYQGCSNADPADPTACHIAADTRPAGVTAAASCGEGTTGCHSEKTATNHGYDAAKHAAVLGAGDVAMTVGAGDPDHGPDWSAYVDCAMCHYSDLGTQHGGKCSTCHAGANPVGSLGTWNQSCQQGDCHPAIHTGMTENHNGAYWNSSASCDSCHTGVPSWPGDVDCTRCHAPEDTIPDTVPPTTSSDAMSSYAGNATIHLTATDNPGGKGVDRTYCILDGGAAVATSTVRVAAPTSGSQSHTLQFYSVDKAGNVESTKPVPAFAFIVVAVPDTTPPAGSMSVNNGALYATSTAVTLNSSVSDAGSGMNQMSVDPGTGAFGGWIAYSASYAITMPANDGVKTVRVRYSDTASNVATLTDTILLDSTPPSTTSNAVAAYTGAASITLDASDNAGGSGVQTTRYRIDAGIEQSGTAVSVAPPSSGIASHSISFWSVDRATNTEAAHTATFTVAAAVSDTTPPTTTSSFNPAPGAIYNSARSISLTATDTGGSGLKATYYRVDGGPYSPGTAFSVASDGLHTFSYYSADNANNTETVNASSQFRIDTFAPFTTSNIAAGHTYTGPQLFALTAADTNGSGVLSTYWQLDTTSGAWTNGTGVPVGAPTSGSASHTLYWYSTDVAGNVESTESVTFIMAATGTQTTTLAVDQDAWYDAYSGASGGWGTYSIYADGVLIGTKPADGTSTWDCPQTAVSSGASIDIIVNCGFFNENGGHYDYTGPLTFSVALPAGSTQLDAATWGGFSDLNVYDGESGPFYGAYTGAIVPGTTITNIAYSVQ